MLADAFSGALIRTQDRPSTLFGGSPLFEDHVAKMVFFASGDAKLMLDNMFLLTKSCLNGAVPW